MRRGPVSAPHRCHAAARDGRQSGPPDTGAERRASAGSPPSALPLGDEAGGGAKNPGAGAERRQFGHRPGDGFGEQGAGSVDAAEGDEGGLAAGGVLQGRLAGGGGRAGRVDQVVGELEGEAELLAVAPGAGASLRIGAGEDGAGLGGAGDAKIS